MTLQEPLGLLLKSEDVETLYLGQEDRSPLRFVEVPVEVDFVADLDVGRCVPRIGCVGQNFAP